MKVGDKEYERVSEEVEFSCDGCDLIDECLTDAIDVDEDVCAITKTIYKEIENEVN